ncbi:hypothetical protein RB2654_14545 [Rhodobacterales bacterium HTCC2654]|uniref:Uncharacterized protein n=1 Tax=Maritimibacter alkaliphilus HTCC2654 TaxID=314271 RepID=A3VGV8_9RHOB|nr:hypothetical protein RB2654_14545 [Rhodobacterales bacterium HTCC2654] [Maritimibacter alkaliphilus HTCC2654]
MNTSPMSRVATALKIRAGSAMFMT